MPAADQHLGALGYAPPTSPHDFVRLGHGSRVDDAGPVAEEIPVAIIYNQRPHVVVMATPRDLEDLAVGFSITEGIVDDVSELVRVDVVRASHGVELHVEIPAARAESLRARSLASRTGCGLCGVESIDDAMRLPASLPRDLVIDEAALWRAGAALNAAQPINDETRTVHAAAWADATGALGVVREDVGRHNALDKVLGALARTGVRARGGFIVVTSRASYEMVQKTASCGVELLAAISRPTALAIRVADATGLTLVGLLRGASANVYTNQDRIRTS